MPRFQPTFRGRLRLFFAVIVIVPMIAVAGVLWHLLGESDSSRQDSRLGEAQTGAGGLYLEARRQAAAAAQAAERDVAAGLGAAGAPPGEGARQPGPAGQADRGRPDPAST